MPYVKYIYSRLLALHLLCATLLAACGAPPENEAPALELEEPLGLEELTQEENLASLLSEQPPPPAYLGGAYECPFEDPPDACAWFNVPDAIVIGEVLAARKTVRSYDRPFGPENAAAVANCPDKSEKNFSIEITLRVKAQLEGPDDVYDQNNLVTFLVNSSAMRRWSERSEIIWHTWTGEDYLLEGVIEEGQLLGASLFRLGDGWASSTVGLFTFIENEEGQPEFAIQQIEPCYTFVAMNGIEVSELITTVKQCTPKRTLPELLTRTHFERRMLDENLSMATCL